MKYSRQREMILQVVVENPCHPTADTVYDLVRLKLPTVSLGTVYRNLNLLAEQGLLQKICLPNQSDRFDAEPHAHHHLMCEVCGRLFDLPVKTPELSGIARREVDGFRITGCNIYFTGVCQLCRQCAEQASPAEQMAGCPVA